MANERCLYFFCSTSLVVLHDRAVVLLGSDGVSVLRRQTEGLHADVCAPLRDHHVALLLMGLQSHAGRDARPHRSRCRRHIPRGTFSETLPSYPSTSLTLGLMETLDYWSERLLIIIPLSEVIKNVTILNLAFSPIRATLFLRKSYRPSKETVYVYNKSKV